MCLLISFQLVHLAAASRMKIRDVARSALKCNTSVPFEALQSGVKPPHSKALRAMARFLLASGSCFCFQISRNIHRLGVPAHRFFQRSFKRRELKVRQELPEFCD
jgi:hypothetical protein